MNELLAFTHQFGPVAGMVLFILYTQVKEKSAPKKEGSNEMSHILERLNRLDKVLDTVRDQVADLRSRNDQPKT